MTFACWYPVCFCNLSLLFWSLSTFNLPLKSNGNIFMLITFTDDCKRILNRNTLQHASAHTVPISVHSIKRNLIMVSFLLFAYDFNCFKKSFLKIFLLLSLFSFHCIQHRTAFQWVIFIPWLISPIHNKYLCTNNPYNKLFKVLRPKKRYMRAYHKHTVHIKKTLKIKKKTSHTLIESRWRNVSIRRIFL